MNLDNHPDLLFILRWSCYFSVSHHNCLIVIALEFSITWVLHNCLFVYMSILPHLIIVLIFRAPAVVIVPAAATLVWRELVNIVARQTIGRKSLVGSRWYTCEIAPAWVGTTPVASPIFSMYAWIRKGYNHFDASQWSLDQNHLYLRHDPLWAIFANCLHPALTNVWVCDRHNVTYTYVPWG